MSFKVRDSFFVKGFKGSTKSNGSVFSAEKRSGDSWQAPALKRRSVTGDELSRIPLFPRECRKALLLAALLAVLINAVISEDKIDWDRLHSLAPVAVGDDKALLWLLVNAGCFHLCDFIPESLVDDLLVC